MSYNQYISLQFMEFIDQLIMVGRFIGLNFYTGLFSSWLCCELRSFLISTEYVFNFLVFQDLSKLFSPDIPYLS